MNTAVFVLILMLLAHLLADYPLQGWLAQAKARKYWENSPKKNRHDRAPMVRVGADSRAGVAPRMRRPLQGDLRVHQPVAGPADPPRADRGVVGVLGRCVPGDIIQLPIH